VVISVEQLRALVREELADALAKGGPQDELHDILDREQAAKLIGVTTRTIPRLVERDGLPTLRRVGKLWRFRRTDVMAWLAAKKSA
jgi:excisionase family DNA binding protein